MAERHSNSHAGRTVAVVGGGAFLLWLLLRGKGWGMGGKGEGSGTGAGSGSGSGSPPPSPPEASPRRCKVRIAAGGIAVDGKPATVEEAVVACKSTEGAEVLVTGGARKGDHEDLKAAFERAGIRIWWIERMPRGAVAASASAWVFPVPTLGDRRAEISDGWGSPRTLPDGTTIQHLGADIMFRRRDVHDLIAIYRPG